MSSQDGSSTVCGNPATYEKLCCLFLSWTDATNDKIEQIKELQSVFHDKYGAFCQSTSVDHTDLKDSERVFSYVIEGFVKENDSQKNLLVIVYSGSSYVHQGHLFLEPHQNTEPTVQWTDYVDRRILLAVAKVLLIFDTTNMRPHHYAQMWKETCKKMDALRRNQRGNMLSVLATNGSETSALSSTLGSMASASPDGFTISGLCDTIQRQTVHTATAELYRAGFGGLEDSEVDLVPLARPRLRLYEHHIFKDPHDEYLKDHIRIHQDGSCQVIKVSLGCDLQQFSPKTCVVAVKRFYIRPRTRPYVHDDFLREKDHLVEVSKWKHPHLLGMLSTFETRCSGFETLNIVLPYARGGNLYEFLRLEQDTRWERLGFPSSDPDLVGCLSDWRYAVFREAIGLAEGVAALHADNNGKFIIHCDIKPANILIDDGMFKLADFGLSRFKDSDETSKTEWHRGTALYSPPERESLMGRGRDVWALGCVLLEIAFMIRYAFQFAFFGKMGATQAPKYEGIRNFIDMFELDRKNSISTTGERTAIYYKTIDCVRQAMGSFYTMRRGLRKRITVDGMFAVIERMMEEDQTVRITAAEAAAQLRDNYLRLQDDPQLQEAITERDNPGGPPAIPFSTEEWLSQFGGVKAERSFNYSQSAVMSSPEAAQRDSGPYHPVILRTATAPTGSSGATDKMSSVALHETRRTVSAENTPYHPLPDNPRLGSSQDLGGAMNRSEGFGGQDHRRTSSYEEDGSNKRRRIDVHFRS